MTKREINAKILGWIVKVLNPFPDVTSRAIEFIRNWGPVLWLLSWYVAWVATIVWAFMHNVLPALIGVYVVSSIVLLLRYYNHLRANEEFSLDNFRESYFRILSLFQTWAWIIYLVAGPLDGGPLWRQIISYAVIFTTIIGFMINLLQDYLTFNLSWDDDDGLYLVGEKPQWIEASKEDEDDED